MAKLEDIFNDFDPKEIKTAIKVLTWVAGEQADNNNLMRDHAQKLQDILDKQIDEHNFMITNEPHGFSALRDSKLNTLGNKFMIEVEARIKNVVKKEFNLMWLKIAGLFGLIAGILGFIFWVINHNEINKVTELINKLHGGG